MSTPPPRRLKVQRRIWIDPHTEQPIPVIVIGSGKAFVRIPITQAYDIVNRVHDLTEAHETQTGKAHE